MNKKVFYIILCCIFLFVFSSCKYPALILRVPADRVYTLYRNSPMFDDMRIHVATFDADDKEEYNCENCNIAISLFQNQPGVLSKYWCEKGYYKN